MYYANTTRQTQKEGALYAFNVNSGTVKNAVFAVATYLLCRTLVMTPYVREVNGKLSVYLTGFTDLELA